MKTRYLIIVSIIILFSSIKGFGQDTTNLNGDSIKIDGPEPLEFVFRPHLSMGIGMFTFYGDVASYNRGFHPTVSRLGYDLRLINPLTEYLDMSFYVLFGQMSATERTLTRNVNFNTNITTGGLSFNYNFSNFFHNDKKVFSPYLSVGIESFEFLSKTDTHDQNGNVYHYWSDGTIRNMDENDPNAENAIEIYRDYIPDTDIRKQNLDGFGDYSERSWAIPIEIGGNLKLGKRVMFRIGTSMHFAFTDLVDGITVNSLGNRKGDAKNDKFLYTHFALSYDLIYKTNKGGFDEDAEPDFDLYRESDTADSDHDLVVDLADLCAKTPEDARPVDEYGCPLDSDNDGVPDYLDEEINSPEGANVKENGVAYTDEDYLLAYRIYMDSTGEFSEFEEVRHSSESEGGGLVAGGPREGVVYGKKGLKYTVVIGAEEKGVTANDLHEYLSYKNFKIVEKGDSVYYVVGSYDKIEDALAESKRLENEGVDVKHIGKTTHNKDGSQELDKVSNKEIEEAGNVAAAGNDDGTVYRVQIGAFRKRLSSSVFNDVPDVVYIKGEDGLYRYYSGSFNNTGDAAKHRVNMLTEGYKGSFIVAFKDGDRLKLQDAGFEVSEGYDDVNTETSTPSGSVVNPELIKFRVQVGAYDNDIPTEVLDLYLSIGNVKPKRDPVTGMTKYFIGEFQDYDEAEEFARELEREGLVDSFVIGEFNGKIITAQEALELLNR